METIAAAKPDDLVDQRVLSKLKWRCRRGLLENDIFIERFFKRFEATLNVKQVQGLNALMELSDGELLDLNLGRKTLDQIDTKLIRADVSEVLSMLRSPPERSL